MAKRSAARALGALTRAFTAPEFLARTELSREEALALLETVDWPRELEARLPAARRFSCGEVRDLCRPLLDALAPEPEEGWLSAAYRYAVGILYPEGAEAQPLPVRQGCLCLLQVLQVLLREERRLPFDPRLDFAFCTEEELAGSFLAEEYRRFLSRWQGEYVYELLRLGQEVTPYRTLEHIAGVHHVAMRTARAFAQGGGLVDLALMSAAAAGHDIGKFGCRAGERVPYLHYHYTDQWFARQGLSAMGHIAANHSVWDLEIENLSAESLILVYSDFRVKQSRDEHGGEITEIFSLKDSFDVILSKLDNVDEAKRLRYRFVYAKLRDFEEYLIAFGVDTTLRHLRLPPPERKDAALLSPDEVVVGLRRTAVDHNIRLMHRFGHDHLFASMLESARSQKHWAQIRAYISAFEEYFTYLTDHQKEQTLDFLYELLVYPDGDIRRQAAVLMGRILADFRTGYRKEHPQDAPSDPGEDRPYLLWAELVTKLIQPDRRLTPKQTSTVRYTAKLVAESLLAHCSDAAAPRFVGELLRRCRHPADLDAETAFALLDAVVSLPAGRCTEADAAVLTGFAAYWLRHGAEPEQAAAARLFDHLLAILPADSPVRGRIAQAAADFWGGSTPLRFAALRLRRQLGLPTKSLERLLDDPEAVSSVFLDNLKTATHWVLKAIGVEYLLYQAERTEGQNLLHIATHFSNLIKVSENVVVRRMAGESLLAMAPSLSRDRRNEIAVELSKALESGQSEISKYIPEYLGQFALWLSPRELDEVVAQMEGLLSSPNENVADAALTTIGSLLAHYSARKGRFSESAAALDARRRHLTGLLLTGLASYRESERRESLRIFGDGLFASELLTLEEKTELFTLTAKKILCLIQDRPGTELTFFHTAAALSRIYRFIVLHKIECGPFLFRLPEKVAFFPGTFDPFSLSHKGIVQDIRDRGFEVYLAIDEFSWSKKTQPSLVRRQLASMSVADEFDVYLFPHDFPVNLSNPDDLQALRCCFAGRELYLAVGSDVVANASSYRLPPSPGCVQEMNHIVFRRQSDADGQAIDADLSRIRGKVLELQLPTHLEDISSSRIRDNIDLGRDISNLIDPKVQDLIYRNGLYLREPQYKRILLAGDLEFRCIPRPDDALRVEAEEFAASQGASLPLGEEDTLLLLRRGGTLLGALSMRDVGSAQLYGVLGSADAADAVRRRAAGRIRLLSGMVCLREEGDLPQALLTEALAQALRAECGCALVSSAFLTAPERRDLLRRSGFLPLEESEADGPYLVDMRSPVALIRNIATTLKEPFASDPSVLAAVRAAHLRFQSAIAAMYPGTLILSLDAELIYHRLSRRIAQCNGVPETPTVPRVLGPKMCVPFGKILRGNVIPNTVTKTLHTDKVFAPDLRSFTIGAYPGYAPLESQIRMIRSFRRDAILVDDLLHSGSRMRFLAPLLRQYQLPIDRVLVGVISNRGRDLMADLGFPAEGVYSVPNLHAWFVESTMYPFIGGDAVEGAEPSVPGLTAAVNLILPYAMPRFCRDCRHDAVYRFSKTCLENSRDILTALEKVYRERFARSLTLSRLGEAVVLPLSPDKGRSLRYDPNLPASECVQADLEQLLRMRDAME